MLNTRFYLSRPTTFFLFIRTGNTATTVFIFVLSVIAYTGCQPSASGSCSPYECVSRQCLRCGTPVENTTTMVDMRSGGVCVCVCVCVFVHVSSNLYTFFLNFTTPWRTCTCTCIKGGDKLNSQFIVTKFSILHAGGWAVIIQISNQ